MLSLQAHGVSQRAQGAYGASLPADQLSHVAWGHTHFNKSATLLLHFAHVDGVDIVNQRLNYHLDGISHLVDFRLQAGPRPLAVCRWP